MPQYHDVSIAVVLLCKYSLLSLKLFLHVWYRPLEITTEEFSKKWGTFTYEKKLKLQYSVSKPEEFMEAVKSKLNFHLIQIIGKFLFARLHVKVKGIARVEF